MMITCFLVSEVTGEIVEGKTSTNSLRELFGDLISAFPQIEHSEYQQIIDRCIAKGWTSWAKTWEVWRAEGFPFDESK